MVSAGLMRVTGRFEAITAPVSRLMKLTFALRISPGYASLAGRTAVMSWIVADRMTVAVELVVDDVDT